MNFNVIFPALPGSRKIDPFWEKEAEAAKEAGFGVCTVTDPNELGPIRVFYPGWSGVSPPPDAYLYRGWIVKPNYYQELYTTLSGKLLNGFHNYMWSYNFPKWYDVFLDQETPSSFVYSAEQIVGMGLEAIAKEVSQRVGAKPLILKDYLKSRKHEWLDACFIPDASDTPNVIRVMTNFFDLQGRDFYGGLVFREYLALKKLGVHPKSGMPLPVEFRTFFLNQKPMVTAMYWDNDVPYPTDVESPPQAWLEEIGKKMQSPFVALDIAQSEDGKWWVIEVNDGGTAGYPEHLDSHEFYRLLYQGLEQ